MKLKDSFTIPADHERSWELLQDLPRVARCLPGAQLLTVNGDTCTGMVKVKIGPIVMTYQGELEFTQRDAAAGVMAMEAAGRDKRSSGAVSGSMRLVEASTHDDRTTFDLEVDLDLTGKPAQFGRSAIQDVSTRLIGQFAQNLAALVDEDEATIVEISSNAQSHAAGRHSAAAPLTASTEPFDLLSGNDRKGMIAAGVAAAALLTALFIWALRRPGTAGGSR